MAAMTGQELIDAVKSHLGDRSSGMIGSIAVDTAVMNSVNKGLLRIGKKYNTKVLQRNLSLTVTDAAYRYAEPVLDSDGTTAISIKNYIKLVSVRSGETTGQPLVKLTTWRRDQLFPVTNISVTGRPQYYSVFASYLEFYPYPEDDYTISIRANIWPTKYTASNVDQVHPLGEQWDEALEAFATHDCFAKLQQSDDAASWYVIFRTALHDTKIAFEDDPDWAPEGDMLSPARGSGNQSIDPFVQNFN